MPILTIFQKFNNDAQNEKRCYFGLMSLRTGVMFNSALSLAMLFAFPVTVSKGEGDDPTDLLRSINLTIPIPFTDRGIKSNLLFELVLPLVAAYGAHKQSRKLIRSAKKMWCIDLAVGFFCVPYCCYKVCTAMSDHITKSAIEKGLADTDFSRHLTSDSVKIIALVTAGSIVTFMSAEAYFIHVIGEYEKQLLSKEQAQIKKTRMKKVKGLSN